LKLPEPDPVSYPLLWELQLSHALAVLANLLHIGSQQLSSRRTTANDILSRVDELSDAKTI